jgi:hypothetical protein
MSVYVEDLLGHHSSSDSNLLMKRELVMHIIPWPVPIKAQTTRANDLEELRFDRHGLCLTLVEDETEQGWLVTFTSVQAFRTTTEECAWHILTQLPHPGGFFEVLDSSWVQELGKGEVHFLEKSHHFIVCCYDEIVEVVAWEVAFQTAG